MSFNSETYNQSYIDISKTHNNIITLANYHISTSLQSCFHGAQAIDDRLKGFAK